MYLIPHHSHGRPPVCRVGLYLLFLAVQQVDDMIHICS
jgi:hypothetical protein